MMAAVPMTPSARSHAPTLETERLVLRRHRPSDLDAMAAMWADAGVTRFIGGRPFTREECWARLLRYAGLWPTLGFGYWAIEDKAEGRFLGEAGFADFKRDMTPSIEGLPEAGWVLAPSAHRKGFATEAVSAMLSWADRNPAIEKTVCIIHPDHSVSLRVAAKLGYRESARTSYNGNPIVLLERRPAR